MLTLHSRASRVIALAVAIGAVVITVVPVLSIVAVSLQGSLAGIGGLSSLFTHGPVFNSYLQDLTGPYLESVFHSFVVGVTSTALSLLLTSPAAYYASRKASTVFGRTLAFNYLVRGIPGLLFLLPLYVVLRDANGLNTFWGMAFAYQILIMPTMMSLLLPFFRGIPSEIYEAADLDSVTQWKSFTRIAVPLAKGAMAAAAVLGFVTSWNEFVFALVLTGPATVTAPVDILNFIQYETVQWAQLAAGAVILMIPGLVMGSLAGRYLVRGFGAAYA